VDMDMDMDVIFHIHGNPELPYRPVIVPIVRCDYLKNDKNVFFSYFSSEIKKRFKRK